MEESTVPVEGNFERSDSSAATSKSLGPVIPVNAIWVDLGNVVEESPGPIEERFSIRGYVAGMREKDRSHCLPFASDDLSPLSVPSFQWWKHFVPETNIHSTVQEVTLVDTSNASKSSSVNSGNKDTLPYDTISDSGTMGGTMIGNHTNRSEDFGGIPSKSPHSNSNDSNSCSVQRCIRNKEGENPSEETHSSNAGPTIYQETDIQWPDASRTGDMYEVEADDSSVFPAAELPFQEPDESNNILSRNSTSSNGLRRRKPKLRFLNDIMEEKGKAMREATTKTSSSSRRSVLAPQCQNIISEDGGVIKSFQRKRRTSYEDDRTTSKKLRTIPGHMETTCRRDGTSDSIEEGASAEFSLQSVEKLQRGRPRKNKVPDIIHRKIHNDDGTVHIEKIPNLEHDVGGEITFFHSINVSSTSCQVGADSRNCPSGEQKEQNSSLSKAKGLEITSDEDPSLPHRSSGSEESNVGNGVMDLPHGGFVVPEKSGSLEPLFRKQSHNPEMGLQRKVFLLDIDLNKPLSDETDTAEENGLIGVDNILDTLSAFHTNENGVRQEGFPVLPSGNDADETYIDDIPVEMEIIELLAKKLDNGTVENSRMELQPEASTKQIRGSTGLFGNKHPRQEELPPPQNNHIYHPFLTENQKGRTISDIKSSEKNIAVDHTPSLKQGKSRNSMQSLDPCPNDTIRALQLLSMMNQGLRQCSGVNMGAKPVYCPDESSKHNSSYLRGQASSTARVQESSLFGVPSQLSRRDEGPSMPIEVEAYRNSIISRSGGSRVDCLLNCNPADFSFPHARSVYMINAKDLQGRKIVDSHMRRKRAKNVLAGNSK